MSDYQAIYFCIGVALAIFFNLLLLKVMLARMPKDADAKANLLQILDDEVLPAKACYALAALVYVVGMMACIVIWPMVVAAWHFSKRKNGA